MKPEEKMWKTRIRPILKAIRGLDFDRIETRMSSTGVPDIAITTPNGHGWIEMKVAGALFGNSLFLPSLTPQQFNWIKTRGTKTGRVWVAAWQPRRDILYMFNHIGIYDVLVGQKPQYYGYLSLESFSENAKNTAYWVPKMSHIMYASGQDRSCTTCNCQYPGSRCRGCRSCGGDGE